MEIEARKMRLHYSSELEHHIAMLQKQPILRSWWRIPGSFLMARALLAMKSSFLISLSSQTEQET
jgi:hypothetical protein